MPPQAKEKIYNIQMNRGNQLNFFVGCQYKHK
jgi:hypothetical protein